MHHVVKWSHGMPVPTLQAPKMTMIINLKKVGDVSSPYPGLHCINVILHAMQHETTNARTKETTKKNQHRPPDRQTRQREKHQRAPTRSSTEKKTRRDGNLGEGENEDERIEGVVLGRDEETQGESQTPEKGFGFPQHLRKRERKRENGVDETNQTTRERKRGDSKHRGRQGSGLEGRQTKQHSNPRD